MATAAELSGFPWRVGVDGADPELNGIGCTKNGAEKLPKDIAVVGLACRLPGHVASGSDFWEMLLKQRSGQCDVPSSRFNIEAFYHPDGVERPGSTHARGGYFIQEDVRNFENDFFGINNLEATYMDPQQRKLLEVVYECFEAAGVPLDTLSKSNTGCYVGNFTCDHSVIQDKDSEYYHRYVAVGSGAAILANRLSHAFNLTGPSLTVDTACSSTLYSLHLACMALENGECDGAVVAAANLIMSPEHHLASVKAGFLSPTSICHTFDESADGYARAEGVAALYLKRLEDAIRDGDPIRSVIRGTAVNANGKTPGISVPSVLGQMSVIRKAYEKAGLTPDQTAYVECHGTGTAVGDPLEVEALSGVFKPSKSNPLLIGSVKTNVGHGEGVSGLSGIIKATLALEKAEIPATIGVKRLNPKIKADSWNVEVVSQTRAWPISSHPTGRRISVNSFGYGGANAHAILQDAESCIRFTNATESEALWSPPRRTTYLFAFSAATTDSLKCRLDDMLNYDLFDNRMADLAYTLGHRRTHFTKRGFVVATAETFKDELSFQSLHRLADDTSISPLNVAFVFTGQGAQYAQMGKELLDEFPVFQWAIQEMDSVLQSLPNKPDWFVADAFREPEATSKVNEVTYSQTLCTALQIALILLLDSWDIHPSAVIGHSSGEIAAAFAAGHISLAQAIAAAYYRGYAVSHSKRTGGMIAVGISHNAAEAMIVSCQLDKCLRIACVNSPENVTVSGDEHAIESLAERLLSRQKFVRKLQTGGRAYHSHHMIEPGHLYQELLDDVFERLALSRKLPLGARFISTVDAAERSGGFNPSYWRSNLENPVLFANSLEKLAELGGSHLVEVGPHSALQMPIKQNIASLGITETKFPYSSALSRKLNPVNSVLALAGRLFLHGQEISFAKVNQLTSKANDGSSKRKCKVLHDLPRYKWHYDKPLWSESRASLDFRFRKFPRHELLGSRLPGGHDLSPTWRNLLRLEDVPWLADHRLEDTTVFPAAGWIAMAVEALFQISEPRKTRDCVIRIENLNIPKALPLEKSSDSPELFTSLRPTPITGVSKSNYWWDFEIVCHWKGISTVHATGCICVEPQVSCLTPQVLSSPDLEPVPPRIWYDRFTSGGIHFLGKHFQTATEIRLPRVQNARCCSITVPLIQHSEGDNNLIPTYPIHPITIDAMFQAGLFAMADGKTHEFRVKVPTRIASFVMQVPRNPQVHTWSINTTSQITGLATANVSSDLVNEENSVVASLSNTRFVPYETLAQVEDHIQRHPMLRLAWIPDIYGTGLLAPQSLTLCLDEIMGRRPSKLADTHLARLVETLVLLAYKNPRLRVLELEGSSMEFTQSAVSRLIINNVFRSLQSYTIGYFDESQQIFGRTVKIGNDGTRDVSEYFKLSSASYDLIILPDSTQADGFLLSESSGISDLLSEAGMILTFTTREGFGSGNWEDFEILRFPSSSDNVQLFLGRKLQQPYTTITSENQVILVHRGWNDLCENISKRFLQIYGAPMRYLDFEKLSPEDVPSGAIVFSLLESESPLLSKSTHSEFERVKMMTDNASVIVWLTNGGLMVGRNPDFSLASGLARTVKLEQPALNFITFDINDIGNDPLQTADAILSVIRQPSSSIDFEFVYNNSILYISRFVPDNDLNTSFRMRQGLELTEAPLGTAHPLKIAIEAPGQFDTVYFQQDEAPKKLAPSDVQIDVKAIGLNAKDIFALAGKVETVNGSCKVDSAGIVTRVGSAVQSLKPGDRVVVYAPSYFKTSEIAPEYACQKLLDDEDFTVMSTFMCVFITALYALQKLARIQPGESVLIHSATGGLGIAAIQVARLLGAKIYATVSTEEKRQYLQNTFGIDPANVFNSRDTSFRSDILKCTGGRGVDVVLNSLTGDLLHASWKCLAPFGRFIELGKRDLTDAGRLALDQFANAATYSAFDLTVAYNDNRPELPDLWAAAMREVLELYRQKRIQPIAPIEIFDLSDVTSALRRFSSKNRMGKIAISFENPASKIRVRPLKHKTTFSDEKYYIMVGCLGGIGRSLSRWMLEQGARKFIFLGRSGLDREPAKQLTDELKRRGADIRVIRGDVSNEEDVLRAVDQADGPIGGVIQAAMGLKENLITNMSNEDWHGAVGPKVAGTWNLHNALQDRQMESQLDFFLMISSLAGSMGEPTQANYSAANCFLDIFARYRRSLGMKATSVALGVISEVGYLEENPEIQAMHLRRGFQPITEDEMIQVLDTALSTDQSDACDSIDPLAQPHILTGLEPGALLELRKRGFEGMNLVLSDPRAAILSYAYGQDSDEPWASHEYDGDLPAEVSKALYNGVTLEQAVRNDLSKRFGDLVLLEQSTVDIHRPIASYGMDSMIASELRTWLFKRYKVDIPFLDLLGETVTLYSMSEAVLEKVVGKP